MCNKAIFLDRDGVINEDLGYVHHKSQFRFIKGVFEALASLQRLGFKLIVVTNQAGIARGYYSEEEFASLTTYMLSELNKQGVVIDKVMHCPHHPEFTGKCECRKPAPGMILAAAKDLKIDLQNSFMVGDKLSDIRAGLRSGIKKSYLISENNIDGYSSRQFSTLLEFSHYLSS
ncbi:MAG: D-glycero-beta-D-manno-heptose 1,7-bisphosphate 7-phosphatase [Alphaproteobacteria bacterium]|nr:D-glycero-beta-D-manno-heptose 1,7-bisphosphate 7-phosphatase [Alphaproteobacteria bacterium]